MKKRNILLGLINTKFHNSTKSMQKTVEFIFKQLPYSMYSPDLAQLDFILLF